MELDLRGLYCPVPVFRAREEISNVGIGEELVIIADDPAADEDLRRWAKRAGHEVISSQREGSELMIRIRRMR
ncbi:MAG TPA: sulfurtransferase TusA family protein [Candidatus Methanomethylicus sp.]|nr:sulfurtransferase TusA family protein [Candidatus Methanomethylicus sp.]